MFRHSLLRVGLLPQRVGSNSEAEGIDLSGLGAAPGQLTPSAVPLWERVSTDEMCLVHKRAVIAGSKNRPHLNGADVDVSQHAEAIVAGFEKTYHFLLKYRSELMASDGPVPRFAEDVVRVIIRPTQQYQTLLSDSQHPDMLRDAPGFAARDIGLAQRVQERRFTVIDMTHHGDHGRARFERLGLVILAA